MPQAEAGGRDIKISRQSRPMDMENTKYKILLIEDDKLDQLAFERLVKSEKLPYDYKVAGAIAEAKKLLSTDVFDVVFLDYHLGDGTAFDILSQITETPVIFTTGGGDEEIAVKAMKAGVFDYLIKDSQRNYLKMLPELVKNAIRHREMEQQLQRRGEQLVQEKELLSVTLSSMSDGVVAVNDKKQIVLFNEVAENLTGRKAKDVAGRSIDEILTLVDERTKKAVENPVDKAMRSRKREKGGEYDCLIAKNGCLKGVDVTASPIYKNDGTMLGVVMVLRDVEQQREIDRMKSDFVSSVTHELRTPLTSIKAYTATILRDPNMTEQTRGEFLSIIDEESNRLSKLIEGLLEISRIEAGNVEKADCEFVDITEVIRKTLPYLQPLADKKDILLKAELPADAAKLRCDKTRIQSVITNLLDNAIKFTPERGRVCISVRQRNEELVISVSDSGMGIPKESLTKIFNRFYRVHRPGRQIPGTGLGLAIIKKIVTMHGGRIGVESEIDKGTTFTVYLPLNAKSVSEVSKADEAVVQKI